MQSRLNFKKSRPIEEPTINLTPLIDVVFVILIIFILIAPLLDLEKIDLASGPSSHSDNIISAQEKSPITLHVQADNVIRLNKEIVNLETLGVKLKELKALFPNVKPQLFHDKKAHFGIYQSIKNALEDAEFKELDIILKPV